MCFLQCSLTSLLMKTNAKQKLRLHSLRLIVIITILLHILLVLIIIIIIITIITRHARGNTKLVFFFLMLFTT